MVSSTIILMQMECVMLQKITATVGIYYIVSVVTCNHLIYYKTIWNSINEFLVPIWQLTQYFDNHLIDNKIIIICITNNFFVYVYCSGFKNIIFFLYTKLLLFIQNSIHYPDTITMFLNHLQTFCDNSI